jgi:hypothetical protein
MFLVVYNNNVNPFFFSVYFFSVFTEKIKRFTSKN